MIVRIPHLPRPGVPPSVEARRSGHLRVSMLPVPRSVVRFRRALAVLFSSLCLSLSALAATTPAADTLYAAILKAKADATVPNAEKVQKLCESFLRDHAADERARDVLQLEHEKLCMLQQTLALDDRRLTQRLPEVEAQLLAVFADKPVSRYRIRAMRLGTMPPVLSANSVQAKVRRLADAQRLADEFPELQEPYRTILHVADTCDAETRTKMLEHFLTLPRPSPELKDKARAMLAGGRYVTEEQREKGIRKAREDFKRGHPSPSRAAANLLGVARSCPPPQAIELLRELLAAKDLPDEVESSATYLLRRLEHIGQRLDYRLVALDGRSFNADKLRGKVVVIYFWAVPRRGNHQEYMATNILGFAEQMKRFSSPDLVALAYNLNNDPHAVRNFVDEHRLGLPVVCDGKGIHSRFPLSIFLQSYPAAWVMDREGRVREVQAENHLVETLQALLAEPAT